MEGTACVQGRPSQYFPREERDTAAAATAAPVFVVVQETVTLNLLPAAAAAASESSADDNTTVIVVVVVVPIVTLSAAAAVVVVRSVCHCDLEGFVADDEGELLGAPPIEDEEGGIERRSPTTLTERILVFPPLV